MFHVVGLMTIGWIVSVGHKIPHDVNSFYSWDAGGVSIKTHSVGVRPWRDFLLRVEDLCGIETSESM